MKVESMRLLNACRHRQASKGERSGGVATRRPASPIGDSGWCSARTTASAMSRGWVSPAWSPALSSGRGARARRRAPGPRAAIGRGAGESDGRHPSLQERPARRNSFPLNPSPLHLAPPQPGPREPAAAHPCLRTGVTHLYGLYSLPAGLSDTLRNRRLAMPQASFRTASPR